MYRWNSNRLYPTSCTSRRPLILPNTRSACSAAARSVASAPREYHTSVAGILEYPISVASLATAFPSGMATVKRSIIGGSQRHRTNGTLGGGGEIASESRCGQPS